MTFEELQKRTGLAERTRDEALRRVDSLNSTLRKIETKVNKQIMHDVVWLTVSLFVYLFLVINQADGNSISVNTKQSFNV